MNLKLGAKPAKHDPRDLRFADYFMAPPRKLPKPPKTFGHESLVSEWGMLGNDSVGCCVLSGAAHETMLFTAQGSAAAPFDDDSVLSDYSAITGYVPGDPSTDQGTDVRDALVYRRKIGVLDAKGKRHKIGAFVALESGNVEQLEQASWLFGGGVGVGLALPESALEQFEHGKPWSVVSGARSVGGHYVPAVAMRGLPGLARVGLARAVEIVTWGRVVPMTQHFYERYCEQAYAILSPEILAADGKSLEGFDLDALRVDLAELVGERAEVDA